MKNFNFKITEKAIYLILFFLIYGYYAAGTNIESSNNIFFFLLPLLVLPFIFYLSGNEVVFNLYEIGLRLITKENLIVFFLFFIIFLIISWEKINTSISDDEYYYTKDGVFHSLQLSKVFLYRFSFLDSFSIKFIIQILNILFSLFLFCFIISLIFLTNKSKNYALFLCMFFLILFRYTTYTFGGNSSPHPPLTGFPNLLFTSFFGFSDFSIKLSYLSIYTFFAFYIYKKIKLITNKYLAFFISLSALSVPGLLFLGTTVEQSLWTIICFSIIMFEIQTSKKINYKKFFIIIAFFSAFRILCLLSLLLVFYVYIRENKSTLFSIKKNINSIITILLNSYPLLIIIPFMAYAVLDYSEYNFDRILYPEGSESGGAEFNILSIIKDAPYYILYNLNIISGSLIIFIFIIGFFLGNIPFLLFTLLISLIYTPQFVHDVGEHFLSSAKYLYEIYFPLFLISIFIILKKINIKFIKFFIYLLFLLTFLYNIYFIKNFSSVCLFDNNPQSEIHTYRVKYGCHLHISHPVSFTKSFLYLKKQKDFNFGNIYIPGVYYGFLPAVLNGMTFQDMNGHLNILNMQNKLNIKTNTNWASGNSINIHFDENIKYVIFLDLIDRKKLINKLLNLNWIIVYEDQNKKFKTSSIILKRK